MASNDDTPQAGPLQRELFFPTYIFFADLAGAAALNAELKATIRALQAEDSEGIVRSNVRQAGSWHSRIDLNVHPSFTGLVERLVANADRAFRDLGYDPAFCAAIDNMWAIVSPRYGFNRSHTHPGALWSGVYYVQAPPGAGRIYFADPRVQAHVLMPRYDPAVPRGAATWSEVYYEPLEGRAILFPSWLGHEVEPNMTAVEGPDGDRISISFNIVQRRIEAG